MRIDEVGELKFLRLTYDEELATARKVCQILDLLWVEDRPSIFKKITHAFYKKSNGHDFLVDEFAELDYEIQRYNSELDEDYAAKHGLPDLCDDLVDDNTCMEYGLKPVHMYGGDNNDQKKLRYRKDIARAWKEAWEEYPRRWLHERYPVFPGEKLLNPDPTADQLYEKDQKLEREFWAMVDKKQEFFECSRQQAIIEVSDYTPRASFPENRMADPNPRRVVKPVVELDSLQKEREDEIDEYEREGLEQTERGNDELEL